MASVSNKDLLVEAIRIRHLLPTKSINKILGLLKMNYGDPKRMQKVALLMLAKELNVPQHVPHNDGSRFCKSTQTDKQAASPTENHNHNKTKCRSVFETVNSAGKYNSNGVHSVLGQEYDPLGSSNSINEEPSVSGCKKSSEELVVKLAEAAVEAQPGPSTSSDKNEYKDEEIVVEDFKIIDNIKAQPGPSTSSDKNEYKDEEIVVEDFKIIDNIKAQPGPSTSSDKNEYEDEEIVVEDFKIIDNILILDDPPALATDQQKRNYVKILKDMFPDADLNYLIALCETAHQNPEWLDETITQLLKGEYVKGTYVDIAPINPEVNIEPLGEEEIKDIIEKNYIKFLEFLPEADPTYLHDCAEQCGNDEKAVSAMITNLFETRNYPTFKDYQSRQKAITIQRKYVDHFNVEEFLEIFPDPIKYFNDKNRHFEESIEYDITYLKSRYRAIKLDTLREHYHKNGRNLTRTCEFLDTFKHNMKRVRRDHEIKYPEAINISFIQELAFIENKALIISFLKQKELKREEAYRKATENGEFLECSCCFDDKVLTEDVVTCNEGHIFCKACIQRYIETCMGDGKTCFPCLMACNVEFSLQTLQGVLKASVFSRLLQKKQSEEVNAAGIPGLENCPFCDFAMIPPQDDKVFRCLNSECMKHSCRMCKNVDHIPLRCEEVEKSEEIKVRTFIEDKMTEALIRSCWNCKKKFIKEDGCNKMTCVCGAMMCYLCRQPVRDYKHFNGQGGTEYEKCPLYSNNNELHLKAIINEGKRAKALVMSENPDIQLKHDPTKSFPGATSSSKAHNKAQIQANVARAPRKRRLNDT